MQVAQWYTKYHHIAQTISTGVQYSFLSADNRQCFPFVFCKEFLIDVVAGELKDKPVNLYGFQYNEANPRVDLTHVRVLLKDFSDRKFLNSVDRMSVFLQLLEEKMGCKTFSKIQMVDNSPKYEGPIVLLTSPAKWMLAPPMLSLYALMIRIGMFFNLEDTAWEHCQKIRDCKILTGNIRNSDYLKKAWKVMMDVVESGGTCRFKPDMKDNWPDYKDQWKMHELSGIVSLADGNAKEVCSDWYPKKETT